MTGSYTRQAYLQHKVYDILCFHNLMLAQRHASPLATPKRLCLAINLVDPMDVQSKSSPAGYLGTIQLDWISSWTSLCPILVDIQSI